MLMRVKALAVVASLAIGGYVHAQTAAPPATQPGTNQAAAAAAQPSGACKKEVRKLCGMRAKGDERQSCIKDNIDLNKFSAACKAQLTSAKPSG
jgi:hypothetical protein